MGIGYIYFGSNMLKKIKTVLFVTLLKQKFGNECILTKKENKRFNKIGPLFTLLTANSQTPW